MMNLTILRKAEENKILGGTIYAKARCKLSLFNV